ncbi:MAG TPA: efflux RND transporter permease subunit [Candidatus Limnocylindria bacterium]|nr:efflux RND transporter permease subunit [Candidatus Limnocylindria bacterium]
MSRFSLRYPYFVIVCCLLVMIIGIAQVARMPVDLFPPIRIPVVVVATFYNGMPAEEVEKDITGPFERFFTLGSGISNITSTSLPGVSLIKITFQTGMDSSAAVTTVSNLAMADLRRLPPGTLPPVVLPFDASSLPVCLITLKAPGLTQARLRDLGQYQVRNEVATVPGASVPQPFGGKYRQIMVYVDPEKLQAYHMSVMDVVDSVNKSNLILPSGDVKVGPDDYNLFTNSQINIIHRINDVPLRATTDGQVVTVADVGQAKDAAAIQTNVVRIDGQPSVYLPVLRQGGDANTISIVNGVRDAIKHVSGVPKNLVAQVVFDQSTFVKESIENLIHEGLTGLILTGLMILIFLASPKATAGVFLSIPLSVLATFIILDVGGNSINTMILGGLALAFSRLIDNSVVVLENIFRHMEEGATPREAAEEGAREVALPVLAATITTAIVFFPVTLLTGVSKFLFTALGLSVVLALFASYVVAMTIVPLYCARFLKAPAMGEFVDQISTGERAEHAHPKLNAFERFGAWFNLRFEALLRIYDRAVAGALGRAKTTLAALLVLCCASALLIPALGLAYFPRTDPGQFVINLKAPTGTRIEVTSRYVGQVENIIRRIVSKDDLDVIASNIGETPGFSAIYTSNTGPHSAFVQVSLKPDHKVGSYVYMDRVRAAISRELPQLTTYLQSGGLVDAVLNLGLPAPIDIQVGGNDLDQAFAVAADLKRKIQGLPDVSDTYIPQDVDAPSLSIAVNREHARELGLSERDVVSNLITAVTSDDMIAPSYWIDPRNGNQYFLSVQYPENQVHSVDDLRTIPLRSSATNGQTVLLDSVASVNHTLAPTEVTHYQLGRVIDLYVAPKTENLRRLSADVNRIVASEHLGSGLRIAVRGSVLAMNSSLQSFGTGLILAVILVYLILVAQFRSFVDPFIILLAVPPGIAGALAILVMSGTTLNVMSLMGIVMMVGIVVSNSILIVEFAHRLRETREPDPAKAVAEACRVRLRPILMTSLATVIGLIPMALGLSSGSAAYAPLARVVIGGLVVSVAITVFIVPAAYLIVYRRRAGKAEVAHA